MKEHNYPRAKQIKELSGELHIEFEDLNPGLRHAIFLELTNHTHHPLTVTNQPQVQAELLSSDGNPVPTSGMSSSGPIPTPQWAIIPAGAYLGFRIDMQTIGVPTREHKKALLALGGKAWQLKAGEYTLESKVLFNKQESASGNQWVGEVDLPTVHISLTEQMLSSK